MILQTREGRLPAMLVADWVVEISLKQRSEEEID